MIFIFKCVWVLPAKILGGQRMIFIPNETCIVISTPVILWILILIKPEMPKSVGGYPSLEWPPHLTFPGVCD